MKVLVTGADGFVGGWLLRELLAAPGYRLVGGVRMGSGPSAVLSDSERVRVQWVDFDLLSSDTLDDMVALAPDAVVHLAAVASGADARTDPGFAWTVNAAGTARLCEAFGKSVTAGRASPKVLVVSTGEVYGQGNGRPHTEDDPLMPCSPYAASKVGAEVAGLEVARRTGLSVMIARAFPHTGPGQSVKYVVPALADRIRTARRIGAPAIKTGNLGPVRDFLDVRDVVAAYRGLLERGTAGEIYNVSSGSGISIQAVVDRLAAILGVRVIVEQDPALSRANDIGHLVGDPSRLKQATGWTPRIPFEQTLKDLVDAQTD